MSDLKIKYCPFCGFHIPNDNMVKFCSSCGSKLFTDDKQKSQQDEKTLIPEELVLRQGLVIDEEQSEINLDVYNKIKARKFIESEYYSIILKDAPNRQSLVNKLEKVLLRGQFAIRLAVDNMPCLIIYKAKGKDIMFLSETFIAEQASTSIIAGDFNNKPAVEELFEISDTLTVETRQLIQQLPIELWVGDRIYGIFSNVYKEHRKGVIVITNKNIYFVPEDICTSTYGWFVRSYNVLSTIDVQDDCLQMIYKGVKVASITFSDKKKLMNAYQCIRGIVQSAV